ncbi:hypothetical protein [Saccharopolyspora sp. NPDC002578]
MLKAVAPKLQLEEINKTNEILAGLNGSGFIVTAPCDQRDITEFGKELWAYLTGKEAQVTYSFDGLEIDVPSRTGDEAPRATWRINGTLRISTDDRDRRR